MLRLAVKENTVCQWLEMWRENTQIKESNKPELYWTKLCRTGSRSPTSSFWDRVSRWLTPAEGQGVAGAAPLNRCPALAWSQAAKIRKGRIKRTDLSKLISCLCIRMFCSSCLTDTKRHRKVEKATRLLCFYDHPLCRNSLKGSNFQNFW